MKTRTDQEGRNQVRTALALTLVRLIPVFLLAAALVTAGVLLLPIFGKPLISLTSTEQRSVSDLVLAEVREICRFNTVEYHYKVVFPFDFDSPGVSELSILQKLKKHFGGNLETLLSAEERLWLEAVNLARRNGLKPYSPDYHFLVATINIKGGFDLEAQAPRLAVQTRNVEGRPIRTAVLSLPVPAITFVEVEDPDRSTYPFPDLALSPKGWKEIAAFVRDHYVSQSLAEGLLARARKNAHDRLRPLLIQAGYDEIEFVEQASP